MELSSGGSTTNLLGSLKGKMVCALTAVVYFKMLYQPLVGLRNSTETLVKRTEIIYSRKLTIPFAVN